ncbi:MAG: hypothetical protein LUH18_06045 [Oscillospiraceae bacterium]|nr:hypothetical protein [Oscillospiraceae bacterium]
MRETNYEEFRMDIILFDREAWTDVVTSTKGDTPVVTSKIEAAIAQAEAEYEAYQ